MTIKYVVYVRVSSVAQVGTDEDIKVSIPLQLADCHSEASSKGWVKAERSEYIEPGVTGELFETRPALQEMIRDAEHGRFDVVMFRWADRIGREAGQAPTLLTRLTKAGVQIYLYGTNEPIKPPEEFRLAGRYGNMDQLIRLTIGGLMAHIDQARRVELSIKAKRAYVESEGRFMSGRIPFGYKQGYEIIPAPPGSLAGDKIKRIPVPDPIYYPILEEFPKWVLEEHLSDHAIANILNQRGLKTPMGATFFRGYIDQIRRNPFYAGIQAWGRTHTTGRKGKQRTRTWKVDPSTVSKGIHGFPHPWTLEQFEAMQREKQHKFDMGGRAAGSRQPLATVLKCGYCHASMVFLPGSKPNPASRDKRLRSGLKSGFMCNAHSRHKSDCIPNYWQALIIWRKITELLNLYFQEHTTKNLTTE